MHCVFWARTLRSYAERPAWRVSQSLRVKGFHEFFFASIKILTELEKLGRMVLARQPFSLHLGAELLEFEQGRAVIALTVRPEFLQQHGFVHGGIVSYLIDNAITFAGGSVLGENVVTVEFKVNYIRPARGQSLVATAVVEGAGARFAVCRCEVVAIKGDKERRCAVGQGTIALLS